jgi:anti-anti-sigma regulatory factor
MSFNIAKQPEGAKLVLKIAGGIDEDANFQPVDIGSSTAVVLDLSDVTAINSVGIREWIKWVKAFPSSAQLSVRCCPKIIVDQINMVAGFLPPAAIIESFYVPYYAEGSGSEKMVLFERGKEFKDGALNPPAEVKDDSGEAMEMDVIEAKYFKFLQNA